MAMDRSDEKGMNIRSNAQTPHAGKIDDDGPASPADSTGYPDEDNTTDKEASKLQILGLHTRNPIISYNGHVFSCHWASNIGTELLFTARDGKGEELPVLKKLPGQIDLLAASSMRIISNAITMVPKAPANLASAQNNQVDSVISIPLGPRSSDERKSQAHFLEKLATIKAAKGETDDVTVYATMRLTRAAWKRFLEQKRALERKDIEKTLKSKKPKDVKKHEQARKRLEELDREEEMRKEAEKTWERESRPQGKGRTRMVERDTGEPARQKKKVGEDGESVGVETQKDTPRETVSIPTGHDDGFFLGDMEEDDDEVEGIVGSEDDDEDAPGEDEDALGEDDDTQMEY